MSHKPWPIESRFWPKVIKGPTCWFWIGYRLKAGYGKFMLLPGPKPIETTAHRVSWILANGPIPDGLLVLHRCDNPPCVNPEHLFLGTDLDNMKDCIAKGRFRGGTNSVIGEKCHTAKLTKKRVVEIRKLRADGKSYGSLSKRFGVSSVQIRNVVLRRSWNHVP